MINRGSQQDALLDLAAEHLNAHAGKPHKALRSFIAGLKRRALLDVLALDYLQRVVDTPAKAAGSDPDVLGANATHAAPAATQAVKVKSYKTREHKRRTPAQKAAARAAWLASAEAIYESRHIGNKAIGDLCWYELRGLARDNAQNAASYLRLGTEATENAILLDKIEAYAVVDDQATTVRQAVPADVLRRLTDEARAEAPLLVERGMRQYADAVTRREAALS